MRKTVEELLQCPYWIIDILPSQVPEDSPGQFFSVEEYFLQGDRIEEIKQKHIDLILKLNCYRDISTGDEEVCDRKRDPGGSHSCRRPVGDHIRESCQFQEDHRCEGRAL